MFDKTKSSTAYHHEVFVYKNKVDYMQSYVQTHKIYTTKVSLNPAYIFT